MSEPPSSAAAPPSTDAALGPLARLIRLWFGFEDPVGRKAYLITGAALMGLKYALDAAIVYAVTGFVWSPLAYLSPVMTLRIEGFKQAPPWLFVVLAVLTLPFMWIGVSMSIRRAVDVGKSAWVGLAFLVPLLNYFVMIGLAALPSKAGAAWHPRPTTPFRGGAPGEALPLHVDSALKSALLGVRK